MVDRTTIENLQNAEVFDSTGASLGTVKQLYVGQQSDEPTWVTVHTGLFGSNETFVPLAEARTEGNRITVPYEKSFVKDAPNIEENGELTPEQEEELYRYYGVSEQGAADQQDVAGQQDVADQQSAADQQGVADQQGAAGQQGVEQDGRVEGERLEGEHRADVDGAGLGAGAAAGAGVGAAGMAAADRDERDGLAEGRVEAERREGEHRADIDGEGHGVAGEGVATAGDRDAQLNERSDIDAAEGTTLHEERLNVGTERRETGRVRLRKYIVSDTERVEVPVEREEVVLERMPASGERDGAELSEGEVEVPVHEERAVVDKETVATEDVRLGTKTVQDTETVQADVAREEVAVDQEDGRGIDGDVRR